MKKNFSIVSLLGLALCMVAVSCGNGEKTGSDTSKTISEMIARSDSSLPNYRYVDIDSVLSNYNLAKDYNEEMLRMQNNMQSEVKKHENSLQSFATTVENKRQNNGYLSEASFNADMQQYNDMQNKAQRAVATLQNNFETAAMIAQKTVNDSIDAFIRDYNMTKGYDAIFFKAASLYINPALDITQEVIEGLNARYNKVKK